MSINSTISKKESYCELGISHLRTRFRRLAHLGAVSMIAAWCLMPMGLAQTPAVMTSPANNSTLSTPSVTFQWTPAAGAAGYFLYVGTAQGQNDILGKSEGMATSQVVSGLPNGTIWVRLWTLIGSTWWINDYSYTIVGGTSPAVVTSPAN